MLLVIETATAACSVALIDDGQLVAERHEVVGRGHAERLIPMIAELPRQGRADAILVDCGPGSFTGVRVGLAAARALGFAWSVPVAGFSSLALLAAAALTEDGAPDSVGVAVAGGHGELFVQRFAASPLCALGLLASLDPDAAGRAIVDAMVVGPGAETLVAARGSGRARQSWPRAADAVLLPLELAGLPPSPLYGRAPDARLPTQ